MPGSAFWSEPSAVENRIAILLSRRPAHDRTIHTMYPFGVDAGRLAGRQAVSVALQVEK